VSKGGCTAKLVMSLQKVSHYRTESLLKSVSVTYCFLSIYTVLSENHVSEIRQQMYS